MSNTGVRASAGSKTRRLTSGSVVYSWAGSALKSKSKQSLIIPNLKRWMGLRRVVLYWVEPVFGKDTFDNLNNECQLLVWQDSKGRYGAILPLLAGDIRFTLTATKAKKGNTLELVGDGAEGAWPERANVAVVKMGRSPHGLVDDVMRDASELLGTFKLRDHKAQPAFIDALGWCTWDAFYHRVSKAKLRSGLRSFAQKGVQLGHMIVDDGWLDTTDGKLNSFSANDKFKGGLSAAVRMAKEEFGLQSFGVWHAFQGYWQGINPKSPLGKSYRMVHNRGKIRPWEGADEKSLPLSLVDPKDIYRFYMDFYRELKAQGVDMTKVDNQSSLEVFCQGKRGRVSTMQAYQEAFQAAGQHYMKGNILHCMSSGSDVGLNMLSSNGYRNSDDYFPRKGPHAQQHHVWVNAYNATLSSHFSVPDWDMFQTHGPCAEFHAMARAISGGPVYVCDIPGRQDINLLNKMGLSNGKVVRFTQPARVAAQDLLVDTKTEKRLLAMLNNNGQHHMIGLFHCSVHKEPITRRFKLNGLLGVRKTQFACFAHTSGALWACAGGDTLSLSLEHAKGELLTCVPIDMGLAALGLLDKYIGCGAIAGSKWETDSAFTASFFQAEGRVGFYCKKVPKGVSIAGKGCDYSYDASTCMLVVDLGPRVVRGASIQIHV